MDFRPCLSRRKIPVPGQRQGGLRAKIRRLRGRALSRRSQGEASLMDGKKVLITGGAGFLGINLIRHLLPRGYEVASLDVEDFDYPERDRVEVVRGDIRNKALVDRTLNGVDFVVHTAAALPLYSPADIHTTDVEGTRNILDAALKNGV